MIYQLADENIYRDFAKYLWKGILIQDINKATCPFNSPDTMKWDIYVIKCSVVI